MAAKALQLAYTVKTGRRAPANAQLPVSQPAPSPESSLRVHAGSYASSTGLDRVAVAPDGPGLVWTRNAGTPAATPATFTPSRDGWFRSVTDSTQIAFRTVQGRRLMLARRLEEFVPPSLFLYTDISSERVPDGKIPASWGPTALSASRAVTPSWRVRRSCSTAAACSFSTSAGSARSCSRSRDRVRSPSVSAGFYPQSARGTR